jgi:peptide/nickel transport system permease protein
MMLFSNLLTKFKLASLPIKLGYVLISLVLLIFILGPLVVPYGFDQIRDGEGKFQTLVGPNSIHLLGTSNLGFDVLSRTILGFQPAIAVIAISVPLGVVLGSVAGVLAAFFRGWVDRTLSFLADLFFVFPALVLSMVVSLSLFAGQTGFVSGVLAAAISTAITFSPKYFRAVRVEASQVIGSGFVQISIASGVSRWRLLTQQVFPNSIRVLPIIMSRHAADAVLVLAGLGFLGLGITPDTGAEWGYDLSLAVGDLLVGAWWTALFPSIALVSLVLGFSLIAEWSAEDSLRRKRESL